MNSVRPPNLAALRLGVRAASLLVKLRKRDPISRIDWLPGQLAFLSCTDRSKPKLIRAGQQVLGKSTASLAECIWLATGEHPWQPGRFCEEVWVICDSGTQSIAIQKKLWELAPAHLLAPGSTFSATTGFRGHAPALQFVLPDGRKSIIKIKTQGQGPSALASASIDHVLLDELTGADIFREVSTRVRARAGTVSLSLTPVDNPSDWLREMVEQGKINDFHCPLTPEALLHTKSGKPRVLPDGTVCDAAWIEHLRLHAFKHEEGVVIDGDWEARAIGQYFSSFDATRHVGTFKVPAGLPLALGIDHGIAVAKQAAVLIAVDDRPKNAIVYVLDEYVPKGATTKAQDAAAILAMLKRHGYAWTNLDYAYGDKPAQNTGGFKKGNFDVEDEIALTLGLSSRNQLKPRLLSVKQGSSGSGRRGSLTAGCSWMHNRMVEVGNFKIDPRCVEVIDGLQKWAGGEREPAKDVIDAVRYALRPWIFGTAGGKGSVPITIWSAR